MPLVSSYTPWKHQKARSFLFSRGVKRPVAWIGLINIFNSYHCTKKWSFPLRNSSVHVTKSAGNCGFGHLLKKALMEHFIFCAVYYKMCDCDSASQDFFISNTFISKTRLNMTKTCKQHPEAELLLFENYSYSSSKLSPKYNRTSSEK